MADKKLIKVEMEFDDGTVQSLSGTQAEEWLKAINGQLFMGQIHGATFPQFEWIIKNQIKPV